MKTKHWILLGGILAAAVLIYVFRDSFAAKMAVETAPAKMGSIREFVDEQAKTRLPQTYLITMPITGRIEAIGLVEGDRVEKGQVVARIVPRDLTLAVEQARAAVQRLRCEHSRERLRQGRGDGPSAGASSSSYRRRPPYRPRPSG